MSQPKKVNRTNVNLPFPYPMLSSKLNKIWPFKEEGFVLIKSTLNQSDKMVLVNETAGTFTLIKMGFFGFNSNKEINHFYLMESLSNEERSKNQTSSNFTLGYYSLNPVSIPMALTNFESDANKNEQQRYDMVQQTGTLPTLKLCLEEAYFLSYVFGIIVVAKDAEQFYNLKELWLCFCRIYDQNDYIQFAVKYAAYHYFRSKGWIVRNGFKFGTDYLLYKEGPPFYHALYSVIVAYEIDDQPNKKFKWNEISALTRVTKNARKELLICTLTIPKGVVQDLTSSPECIRHFKIELVHINRWNSGKGEFDPTKIFHNL